MDDKRLLRASVLAARAVRPSADRMRAERALAEHGIREFGTSRVVAAYAGVGAEPPTRALLDGLSARGVRVLLPCVHGPDLRWGDYVGWDALRGAAHGLLEPAPDDEAAAAAAAADLVLVPALAVDRGGHRLGRGAGYYDRWLHHTYAGSAHVAVVFAEEVVASVPHEPHDVTMTAALTPDGVLALG